MKLESNNLVRPTKKKGGVLLLYASFSPKLFFSATEMAQRVGALKRLKLSSATPDFPIGFRCDGVRVHRRCSFSRNCASNRKPRLRIVAQKKWKLNDIDTSKTLLPLRILVLEVLCNSC